MLVYVKRGGESENGGVVPQGQRKRAQKYFELECLGKTTIKCALVG